MVNLQDVTVLVDSLCDNAFVTKEYVITPQGGKPLNKAFYVKFGGGDIKTCTAKANSVLAGIRDGDGKWRPIFVQQGDDEIRAYINPGKNGYQTKMEIASKKLVECARALKPETRMWCNKSDGVLSIEWTTVARIEIKSPHEINLRFSKGAPASKGLDQDALRAAFSAAMGGNVDVEWCS